MKAIEKGTMSAREDLPPGVTEHRIAKAFDPVFECEACGKRITNDEVSPESLATLCKPCYNEILPHCPHCGSEDNSVQEDKLWRCNNCGALRGEK